MYLIGMLEMPERRSTISIVPAVALLSALGLIGYWLLYSPGWLQVDAQAVARWVEGLGPFGPLAIIALMTLAVVASPIPSAPIALAAGAAFGQIAGTLYVAIGAEVGALAAFGIARVLGRNTVDKLLDPRAVTGLLGSQNALTLAVFVSRLLPFVSFDVMSYAAGLSRIHPWRFILATLAGILPASFALAYLGDEAMSGRFSSAAWIAIGLGLLTATPILVVALRHKSGTVPPSPQLEDPK